MRTKIIAALAAASFATLGLTACSQANSDYTKRVLQQNAEIIPGESLEEKQLKERYKRENDPNRIAYVYLLNFGKPFGYYVLKGKVSSSGSQLGPEQVIACPGAPESCNAVDSSQDDHTYGQGDPGIFFFLANGTKIETTLDYILSDQPMSNLDIPDLGGGK